MTQALQRSGTDALSSRQALVLRAVVAGFLGSGAPVGSSTVASLLPVKLSSASVRATMAELTERGLLEKPHTSAGRIPTEGGLRHFVRELLEPAMIGDWDRRTFDHSFEDVSAADTAFRCASALLSRQTGQLGFVVTPRLGQVVVRHVTFVRLSSERLAVLLVSESGSSHQRVIEDATPWQQAELDRMAACLNERVAGRTLEQIRDQLRRDLQEIRERADRALRPALELGLRAVEADELEDDADIVIATRLALLSQPEFQDPERLRELFAALETRESVLELLDRTLAADRVSVAFGEDLGDLGLRHCAVVTAPYGPRSGERAAGAVGVIGSFRMDYPRVIPLVGYCSQLMSEKLYS